MIEHNCVTTQNSFHNLPSYPPDNYHSSDDVQWRVGDVIQCTKARCVECNTMYEWKNSQICRLKNCHCGTCVDDGSNNY